MRNNRPKQDPIELLKRAAKVGITADNHRLFKILIAHGDDARIYSQLEASIAQRELREELNSCPFNMPSSMQGDIILGKNGAGTNRYESKYAPSHLLGIGATGVGKTVFLTFLLIQYLPLSKGMWIFDFVKRELRGFRRLAQKTGSNVIVCRHENLRVNLLDPQDLDPSLYANVCSEFITLSLGLPPVAKLILKICITNQYEKSGLLLNPKAPPPTLSELIEEIKHFDGNKPAKEAILIRLQALLVNQRQIFSVQRGFKISELARRKIVWEFDGLETQYQNLFVSYLLSNLFAHRVANPCNDLAMVALDEAGRVYSKNAESANEGPSYIANMTSVIRSKRIGLLVWTQSCYDLSNSIIANSGIKVLCRVGTATDYDTFGRAMGLISKQIQWAKTDLGIGSQIIKTGFGWPKPFLNQTPNISIPNDVTDLEVELSVAPLLATVQEQEKPAVALIPPATKPLKPQGGGTDLTDDEKALLEQLENNPMIASATEHYKQAGLSTKRATIAKRSLIARKMIKETPLESGKRGAAKAFLEVITSKGSGRNGGKLHNYLRKIAQDWYINQNCKTECEKAVTVNGLQKFVDLAVTWPDGKKEAVEIETEDTPRALENVQKNMELGVDIITVLAPNVKIRQAIQNRVNPNIQTEHAHRLHFPSISLFERKEQS